MLGSYEQIRADMDALAHYDGRFPASEGERAILHGVKARIPHEAESVVEGFVSKYPDLMVGILVSVLFVGGLLILVFYGGRRADCSGYVGPSRGDHWTLFVDPLGHDEGGGV